MSERTETRGPDGERTTRDAAQASPTDGASSDTRPERRKNPRLRELIDEMLASVRVATRRELWTDEERQRYEAELAEVMRRVRFEAVWKGPSPAQAGGAKEESGDTGRDGGAGRAGTS